MTTLTGFAGVIGFEANAVASTAPSGCDIHPDRSAERIACAADFRHFLNHWWFINRESGLPQRFNTLWPGQERIVGVMRLFPWCFFLKAGKLGFTELECAYDGWVALYRTTNARVHLFSLDGEAAKNLLLVVKFGITHLPDWLGLPILTNEPGGDTTRQLTLSGGADDKRRIVSYPAVKDAAIDQTATHSHVDELARMPWPQDTWSSVESTVAPGGTVHIVTRGAGDGNFTTELWDKAEDGATPLHAHFEPWDARPRTPVGAVPEGVNPSEVFYAEKEAGMLAHELNWFLPRTAEDALKGSGEGAFVSEASWMGCYDPDLPPLQPGDRTPLVLALDAGVTNDCFAAVAVSRHPLHPDDPAVRAVRVWVPPKGGEVDFDEVEDWVRIICWGGCTNGHPNRARGDVSGTALSHGQMCSIHPDRKVQHRLGESGSETCGAEGMPCEACQAGHRTERFNVVQIPYDSYQLVDMAQHLTRDRIAWCYAFGQGGERLEADANLRLQILQRRLRHRNDPVLNDHIRNANAKSSPGEDSKLRLVKRNVGGKIDGAVGLSMATAQCLYLMLANASA